MARLGNHWLHLAVLGCPWRCSIACRRIPGTGLFGLPELGTPHPQRHPSRCTLTLEAIGEGCPHQFTKLGVGEFSCDGCDLWKQSERFLFFTSHSLTSSQLQAAGSAARHGWGHNIAAVRTPQIVQHGLIAHQIAPPRFREGISPRFKSPYREYSVSPPCPPLPAAG